MNALKNNNYNNYDGVLGATMGTKKAIPAISVDTLRGGRKGDHQR